MRRETTKRRETINHHAAIKRRAPVLLFPGVGLRKVVSAATVRIAADAAAGAGAAAAVATVATMPP